MCSLLFAITVYASEVFKRTRTFTSHQIQFDSIQFDLIRFYYSHSQRSITQEFRQPSRSRYDKDGSRGEK